MENIPLVGSQDDINYLTFSEDRNYPTNGGQNGINSQAPGGGNYPLLGSQDGLSVSQILTGRQSEREGMPDELVKRNRLWK